ncbi:MAG: hypothetical protein JKY98_03915, partial [Gammaproteobacteria bacterium]|nr:hypothetical protein [Gammaproteobacteria bacterium]
MPNEPGFRGLSGLRATILDIAKRFTKTDKKLGIINNGANNLYSERVERFINNSVTAKMSANTMATYLIGKGFGDDNDFIVDKDNDTTLFQFGNNIAKNESKQRGVFIHVGYDANFDRSSLKVLPYTHCRLGKKDDNKYNAKIVVYDNWDGENGKINEEDFNVLNVFNPRESVIQSQVDAVGGWDHYKGQILYFNLDEEYNYALSQIDSVMHDCDSEAQSSVFKNKSLRKGFFGKTLVITKPLAGKLEDYDTPELYRHALSQRDNFTQVIESFVGAENVGGALHVQLEHDGDTFEDAIRFEQIDSNIDDKLFEYTESSVFNNILVSFNNIPKGLVRSDNA